MLLSLDPTTVNLMAPGVKTQPWGFPLAWTRSFGQGRVLYCALGHPREAWSDPRLRLIVSGALRWVLREP